MNGQGEETKFSKNSTADIPQSPYEAQKYFETKASRPLV